MQHELAVGQPEFFAGGHFVQVENVVRQKRGLELVEITATDVLSVRARWPLIVDIGLGGRVQLDLEVVVARLTHLFFHFSAG